MKNKVYIVMIGRFENNNQLGVVDDVTRWRSLNVVAVCVSEAIKKTKLKRREYISEVKMGVEIDIN